jgi:hypothetical protein
MFGRLNEQGVSCMLGIVFLWAALASGVITLVLVVTSLCKMVAQSGAAERGRVTATILFSVVTTVLTILALVGSLQQLACSKCVVLYTSCPVACVRCGRDMAMRMRRRCCAMSDQTTTAEGGFAGRLSRIGFWYSIVSGLKLALILLGPVCTFTTRSG